jgi:hypothetical protein
MNSMVQRVLGENTSSLIPSSAEDYDRSTQAIQKPANKEIKRTDTARELSDKEALLSPVLALSAPDCTPDAYAPIDPVHVPYATGNKPEEMTSDELAKAAPINAPSSGALDVLLGKSKPVANTAPVASTAPVSAAEAQALFASPIEARAKADALLTESAGGMPEPVKSSPEKLFQNVHRFIKT